MDIPEGGWITISYSSQVVAPIHQENLPIAFAIYPIGDEAITSSQASAGEQLLPAQRNILLTWFISLMRETPAAWTTEVEHLAPFFRCFVPANPVHLIWRGLYGGGADAGRGLCHRRSL
jgi:hypothetical protein